MTYALSFTRFDTTACTVDTRAGRIANIKLSGDRGQDSEKSKEGK